MSVWLTSAPSRGANILLAEDSDDDAFILSHALVKLGFPCVLTRAEDGEKAIAHLKENPRPDVAVLDVKMPLFNGFEVLAFIRATPALNALPVIMLTGSELPKDKIAAQELGVLAYVVKDQDWKVTAGTLIKAVQKILGI